MCPPSETRRLPGSRADDRVLRAVPATPGTAGAGPRRRRPGQLPLDADVDRYVPRVGRGDVRLDERLIRGRLSHETSIHPDRPAHTVGAPRLHPQTAPPAGWKIYY